jgi:hypothetical protein
MRPEVPDRHWQWVRWIVEKLLPRGNRGDHLDGLDEQQRRRPLLSLESASAIGSTIFWAYWTQAYSGFNLWGALVQTAVTAFCFWESSVPGLLSFPVVVVLGVIALRDARTHHDLENERQPIIQYYLDSAADAVVSTVFVLASQALTLKMAPSLALPAAVVYRGAVVCIPLSFILRAVLRPMPPPDAPFTSRGMTAEEIYRRIWGLDLLFLFTFVLLIVANFSDKPNSVTDVIRGQTITLFGIWRALQSNPFTGRRGMIITLFTDLRKLRKEQMIRTLPRGLKKGEPLYWSHLIMEGAIYFVLTLNVAESVWSWLSGQTTHADTARAIVSVVAFATVMLSWQYVKRANRAAAEAILAAE